jgi:hypothetical protein
MLARANLRSVSLIFGAAGAFGLRAFSPCMTAIALHFERVERIGTARLLHLIAFGAS